MPEIRSFDQSNNDSISYDINPKDIFVIHGHDKENLLLLEKHLKEDFSLNPIILKERAGRSRSLIAKFEQEAKTANFAFVLITPDDIVKDNTGEYFQPRPNAIFELGWFCGRLGRAKTCILYKKGTEIPSDLKGISRVEFSNSIEEKLHEIEKELKAACIPLG